MRAATVSLLLVWTLRSAAVDCNEVIPLCKPERTVACYTYVIGAVDAMDVYHKVYGKKEFCLPSNTTGEQLTSIVMKYIDQNPEEWHYSGAFIVHLALVQAFPCSRSES